jgi:aryl-alcohol dehydrogenase-like predicted oxidoreductase
MPFGDTADEQTSAAMYGRCRDAGINFFDTADVYADGRSEEILGRLIADHREEVVIASKIHFPTGEDVNARGLSRRHIMLGVEHSLRRLSTDWIDVYYVHSFDPHTAMEESLQAMDDLVRQGKILYPAVSNWAAWQIAKATGISELLRLARFECVQPMYSLVKRQAEVEILPLAAAEDMAVVPYSPLGAGLLTGKYGPDRQPDEGRLVEDDMYMHRYGDPEYYAVASRFSQYARDQGLHPATLAVAWVMSHPAVTAPIIGARNVDQLEASLAAADVSMTPEWRAEISDLSPEPPLATDRSEERVGISYKNQDGTG